MREPVVPDLCPFWMGWDRWKKFPDVHKIVRVKIVMASGGGYVPDFEDLSFSWLGYNEVSSAVSSFRSFFDHADVAV